MPMIFYNTSVIFFILAELVNLGILIYIIVRFRKIMTCQRTDEDSEDNSFSFNNTETPSEIVDEVDDSTYEANIHKSLVAAGANVYYENYTYSSVKITGRYVSNYCIELTKDGETKTIANWENAVIYQIKFVFRLMLGGKSYLVWGDDRETAYLNLFEFMILHNSIH